MPDKPRISSVLSLLILQSDRNSINKTLLKIRSTLPLKMKYLNQLLGTVLFYPEGGIPPITS